MSSTQIKDIILDSTLHNSQRYIKHIRDQMSSIKTNYERDKQSMQQIKSALKLRTKSTVQSAPRVNSRWDSAKWQFLTSKPQSLTLESSRYEKPGKSMASD